MKAVLAVVLASVLVASMVLTPFVIQRAFAENPTANLQIYTNFSDGTHKIDGYSKYFNTAGQLVEGGGSKTIESFDVFFTVTFPIGQTITSASVSSPSIKILANDGTYKSVSTSSANTNVAKIDPLGYIWRIWGLHLTKTQVEGIIGSTTGDYSSELRVIWGTGGATITTSAGTFTSPILLKYISFTARDVGGGGTGTVPTGKLFYVISGKTDAGVRWTITSTDIGTLKSADFLNVAGDGTPFDEITFTMKMFLDKDDYLIQPEVMQFTDPASTDNFYVKVEGQKIPITYEGGISSAGAGGTGLYQIMQMTAKRVDIEPLVTKEIATDGSTVWRSGSMTFFVQDAIITMKQGEQVWNIDVPEQHVNLDLFRTDVVDDDPGPCNISGEITTCPQPPTDIIGMIARALGIPESQVQLLLIGVAIAGVGAVVYMKGGKKKIHA